MNIDCFYILLFLIPFFIMKSYITFTKYKIYLYDIIYYHKLKLMSIPDSYKNQIR